MKKIIGILIFISVAFMHHVEAAVISFTAVKTDTAVKFNWTTNSEQNMFYYEIMQTMANGSEKMLTHTDVADPTVTTGVSYQAIVSMSRVLYVAFSGIILVLLIGMLVGLPRTVKSLSIAVLCISLLNISCKKESSPTPPIGDPGRPGVSSSTQGVFRLKTVDLDGNINYTGYILLKY
jgi:hypothetical protein